MADYGSAGMGFTDGRYLPISQMSIPVTDLGFQLSDMCYDALRVHRGAFFRMNDHLDRWENSVAERRYTTLGYDREQVADVLHGCVSRAGLKDSMVTVLATRGSPSSAHKDLRTCKNRLMVWALPFYSVTSEEERRNGCDIIIAETLRIPPESVNPKIKNFCRLDFVGALFEAYSRNAKYAALLDTDGNVTEGRGWNIFAVKEGTLHTPDRGVLEGITRQTVLELSSRLNLMARVGQLPAQDLLEADEVFMTTTAGGVIPIRSVSGRVLGDGGPGPVTRRLSDMYEELLTDPAYTTPVRYEEELAEASSGSAPKVLKG